MGPRYSLPSSLLLLLTNFLRDSDAQLGWKSQILKILLLSHLTLEPSPWQSYQNEGQTHVPELLVMGSSTSRTKPSLYIVIWLTIILSFYSSFNPLGALKNKYNPISTPHVSLFDMAHCARIKGLFIIQPDPNMFQRIVLLGCASWKRGSAVK